MTFDDVLAFILGSMVAAVLLWLRFGRPDELFDDGEDLIRAGPSPGFLARVSHERMQQVVRGVLRELTSNGQCPCDNERFCYFAGKEHGSGWQDSVQNELVEQAVKLDTFDQRLPFEPHSCWEHDLTCRRCGTEWRFFTQEWRMLAYHHRLVKQDNRSDRDAAFAGIISNDIFQTLGMGPPDNARRLTIKQWRDFILGTEAVVAAH